ncbi:hypothetical protein GCM10009733_037330 [Nonomuraea maheshkhaliensis]|uniref:Uncharacterized protein n=1 Tax=Nonomuraea maheshkhaliensis TaxID=419590 RepID=A0ABP4R836_9ACTN
MARRSVADDPADLAQPTVASPPDRPRAARRASGRNGGLHTAGLFPADGEPLCVREHVGRHPTADQLPDRFKRRPPLQDTALTAPVRGTAPAVPPQGTVHTGDRRHRTGQNVTPGTGNGSAGARPPG